MGQQQQQAALTLEQLKAHLEQHSIGTKQPHKQHDAQMAAADEAPDAADGGSQQADVGHGDIELDASDDELMIEPAQQQPRGDPIVAAMLPPDTQELLAELPPRQPGAGGIIAGSEVCAGTATELDLQLGDDGDEDNNAGDNSKGSQGDEDMQDAAGDCSEGEADGSGSGEEELLDSSEVRSGSESESDNSEEQQQSEELAEPEPLHWEEEEQEADPASSSQQEGAGVEAIKNRKGGKNIRRRGAAGGFIDAEADLSDDEGHDEDGESDDEGYEEDAMLVSEAGQIKYCGEFVPYGWWWKHATHAAATTAGHSRRHSEPLHAMCRANCLSVDTARSRLSVAMYAGCAHDRQKWLIVCWTGSVQA